MGRPSRIVYPGAWYHVLNTTVPGSRPFQSDGGRDLLFDLLAQIADRYQVQWHAYHLQSDRYDLLLHTPQGNLERVMRQLNGELAHRYNRYRRLEGDLFAHRYRSVLVEPSGWLLRIGRFIHRRALFRRHDPLRYPWSSATVYLGKTRAPEWLHTDVLMAHQRQLTEGYRRYLATDDPDLEALYAQTIPPPVLGSRQFIGQALRGELDALSQQPVATVPKPAQVVSLVARFCAVPAQSILQTRRGRGKRNPERWLAMALCHRSGLSLAAIADHFQLKHPATVSKAITKLEEAMAEDPALAQRFRQLCAKLAA